MKDLPVTVILLIFGVVFTLIIVGVVSNMTNSGKASAQQVESKMNATVQTALEADYTDYEGTSPLGSVVINLIKKWSNDQICVQVVTKKSTNCYIYTDMNFTTKSTVTIANAMDKTNGAYINQGAKFACTIERDTNDNIAKIIFTQQ